MCRSWPRKSRKNGCDALWYYKEWFPFSFTSVAWGWSASIGKGRLLSKLLHIQSSFLKHSLHSNWLWELNSRMCNPIQRLYSSFTGGKLRLNSHNMQVVTVALFAVLKHVKIKRTGGSRVCCARSNQAFFILSNYLPYFFKN